MATYRFVVTADGQAIASATLPEETMATLQAYAQAAGTPLRDLLRFHVGGLVREALAGPYAPQSVLDARAAAEAAQQALSEATAACGLVSDEVPTL